jgi:farnesyl-diphosphate farnesyltransferase
VVRDQIGLAYLFARAADTIADTDVIERTQRLTLLKDFQAQFGVEGVQWETVRRIQSALVPHQASAGERTLLQRLEECFQRLHAFTQEDQQRIRALMKTLTKGMEMDLTVFTGDSAKELRALQTMEELDRYTYYVAGCVGEFWTHMVAAHLPSLTHWNVPEMVQVGVRFGKGLQLTNIVKDLGRDLQRGRCYVPDVLLQRAGLKPTDLLSAHNVARVQPLLRHLIGIARDHLDQGWLYTMAIPPRERRLRLACMWPILFAGETLWRVAESPDVLNPRVNIKMPKSRVYLIMLLTAVTGGSSYVGTAYWGRLRKMVL